MNKPWLILMLIAGTAGVVTVALRNHAPGARVAAPPATSDAIAIVTVDHTLPDYSAGAVVKALPPMEERVTSLAAAIWQELNSPNEDGHENVFTNLLPELIALDPAAAARLVETTTHQQGREELLRQLIQTWIAKDSAAALAWAEQLPDTNEVQQVLIQATKQMAENDPAAAVSAANRYHLGDRDSAVLPDIAMVWAEKDLPGVKTWAGSQPAGQQRDDLMSRIAFVESHTAPETAVKLVIEEIPPGLAQDEAAISVLHQWANRDFAAAQAWVDQFPASPLRVRALAELAGIASDSKSAYPTVSAETPPVSQ